MGMSTTISLSQSCLKANRYLDYTNSWGETERDRERDRQREIMGNNKREEVRNTDTDTLTHTERNRHTHTPHDDQAIGDRMQGSQIAS